MDEHGQGTAAGRRTGSDRSGAYASREADHRLPRDKSRRDGGSRSGVGPGLGALSGLHPQTGLVPVQLDSLDADTTRPWEGADFLESQDPREADRLDAGAVLESLWRGSVWPDEDDPEAMQRWAPFTMAWPGTPGSGCR